jgi:hypothetical protein
MLSRWGFDSESQASHRIDRDRDLADPQQSWVNGERVADG